MRIICVNQKVIFSFAPKLFVRNDCLDEKDEDKCKFFHDSLKMFFSSLILAVVFMDFTH